MVGEMGQLRAWIEADEGLETTPPAVRVLPWSKTWQITQQANIHLWITQHGAARGA
jgi:hypothetical protein